MSVGLIQYEPTDAAIAEMKQRLEALKPDVQKLADWIDRVERAADDMPTLSNADATKAMCDCNTSIGRCLGSLQKWIDEEAR